MARMHAGGLVLVASLLLGFEAEAGPTRVSGRVVGADGAPVAGADVATLWIFDDGAMKPYGGGKTAADGRFQFEADLYDRPATLVAVDADRKAGGLATVDPHKGQSRFLLGLNRVLGEPVKAGAPPTVDPVEIKLGPLVRVRGNFASGELGKPIGWTNVYMNYGPDKIRVSQCSSNAAAFDMKLPAGPYHLLGYGSEEVKGVNRPLELRADQPDLDLGTVDLKASPLGKMYGREAPPLHVTDARGIGKDVKLEDFRGKWVALEFWGYWCGPCVGRGLPDMMQVWDEHPEDRDKFVILAFHDKQAENFEQLDRKMKPIVESTWGGRELPFPILLDATGRTVEAYGIRSWPTTVLIDPEGKVVRGGEYTLRKALPPVPPSVRLALAIDRQVGFGLDDRTTLAGFAKFVGRITQLDIRLDEPALRAAGVGPDATVPLEMSGQVSLRSWLELALRPLGLVANPGPEGLIIAPSPPGATVEPSAVQAKVAARIEAKLGEAVTFRFDDATLRQVAGFFEQRTGETFILDPADVLAGRLDPKATVTGKADGVPLREGLRALLAPLGMEVVVRDEVVLMSKPARP